MSELYIYIYIYRERERETDQKRRVEPESDKLINRFIRLIKLNGIFMVLNKYSL